MASRRLIPVPGTPPHSAQPSPQLVIDDTGHASESFGRKCAPSQIPRCDSTNCDLNSYDQLHELRKRRGYHKKDAIAAPKARREAMDAAERRPADWGRE